MVKKKDQDIISREKIVQDIDHNYFVEASAGSGKTTSLVYRMVALIEHGVSVDKICTITFTKAAANEFFERFQKLLSIRSGNTPDRSDDFLGERTDDTKRLCQEALANIDLCFLGTIDSFCNMIAHEMPAELKIPSSSSVISKEEYTRVVQEAYYEILKDYEHPLHDLASKFNNFVDNPFDAFVKGIAAVSDFRNLKVIYDSSLSEMKFDDYFDYNDKKNLLEIMDNLTHPDNTDLYAFKSDADKKRSDAKDDLASKFKSLSYDLKNWGDNIKNLKFALKDIKNMDGFSDNAEFTSISDYLAEKASSRSSFKFSEEFNEEIVNYQKKINEYTYSIYFHFVLSVLDEVTESLRKQGKFQFFDFLLYLRDAFKESALGDRVLINHVFERHAYFMLDESQDTNPLQTEMFFYLTSTKKDADWKKMEPKEKSLFIVGDPKQSIYGFRGADVKAYLQNKKIFEDKSELLVLIRNFRSHASLREWFNNSFNSMLNYDTEPYKEFALEHLDIPIDDDDFTKSIPYGESDILEGAYRYVVNASGRTPTDCSEVAKLIIDIMNNKKIYRSRFNPSTKKMEAYKDDVQFSDFLIVPFSSNMAKLIDAFDKYCIPMVVEGKMVFDSAESFNAVLDLLYLLKEPTNKAALNKVIYSDLFKLNDSDVIQMINDGFDLDISNSNISEIKFTKDEHKNLINKLHGIYEKTLAMSFSSTMQFILNDKELNIFSKVTSKDMEYIFYLIEKVKEGEENGSISSLEQFKNYVALFLDSGDEQRTLRFSDKVNRVKIANLHKVKGLQAPIVILARPNDKEHSLSQYIDYTSNTPSIKFSKIEAGGDVHITYAQTSSFDDEMPKWEASSKAEHDRLAYVGATRAESALIVCENNGEKLGYWKELAERINSERTLPIPSVDEILPDYDSVSLGEYHINEKSHNQSFEYISPSQSRSSSRNTNKDEIDDSAYEPQEDKSDSTVKGTIVHRLMECIVSSKNTYNIEDLIKTILSDYGYSKEYEEMLHNVASKILNGGFEQVNSSLDKDVLKTLLSAKKVWCEVPFSYQSDKGNVVSGIIDCMYLDDSGYHIIDYKTNEERDVSVLEKHYEGQLKHYKFALKKMGVEADTHIYHIDL